MSLTRFLNMLMFYPQFAPTFKGKNHSSLMRIFAHEREFSWKFKCLDNKGIAFVSWKTASNKNIEFESATRENKASVL